MQLKPIVSNGTAVTTPAGQPKRHVLYVEDEDLNWMVAAPNLRDKYKLTRARNAAETFEALKVYTFDCILMDIQLHNSDFDGITLTKVLRGTYPGIVPKFSSAANSSYGATVPIIFVTAYTASYSRDDLIKAGGSELISKPVNFVALALTMSRLISAQIIAPR